MVTLLHFTHPLWLEDKGGFENDSSPDAFVTFARRMYREYGGKVRRNVWISVGEVRMDVELERRGGGGSTFFLLSIFFLFSYVSNIYIVFSVCVVYWIFSCFLYFIIILSLFSIFTRSTFYTCWIYIFSVFFLLCRFLSFFQLFPAVFIFFSVFPFFPSLLFFFFLYDHQTWCPRLRLSLFSRQKNAYLRQNCEKWKGNGGAIFSTPL